MELARSIGATADIQDGNLHINDYLDTYQYRIIAFNPRNTRGSVYLKAIDLNGQLVKVVSYYDLFKDGYWNAFSVFRSPTPYMVLSDSTDVIVENLLLSQTDVQ